jgi:hypothetical protein
MNAAPTLAAERLKEADDVKRALHEVSPERTPPKVETKDRLWFGSYLMLPVGNRSSALGVFIFELLRAAS